tara:strand:- start:460 stop:1065 length:606 start_codon:yes stop_codon:yes gene_type:complete
MKNDTILIIGNGNSVIKNELGEYINKYNYIARINNYKIKGYEKYLGEKTDIWLNGANSKLNKRNKYPEEILVFIPSLILDAKKNEVIEHVSKRLKLNYDKFKVVPKNEIIEYENIINHNRLTTGLYAILWGLKYFNNVVIYGFDFFIDSKTHYFDSKFERFLSNYILRKGHKHDNKKEKEYVDKMILNKKIKRLEDCCFEK